MCHTLSQVLPLTDFISLISEVILLASSLLNLTALIQYLIQQSDSHIQRFFNHGVDYMDILKLVTGM